MKVFFMKTQLKHFITHLLIIRNLKKYNNSYFNKFSTYPNEITILTYDALGLIYYAWKSNGQVQSSINDFLLKVKLKEKSVILV